MPTRSRPTPHAVVPIPEAMDFVTAAAFPVAYGTSHFALTHRGNLKPGETLLVLGAAGGVGLTAVEIGKQLGARVIAAAGGPDKLAVAREHGADELIDYRSESIRDRVRELTGGLGADVVYDPVGGDAFDQALRAVNWEARMLVIGFASGRIQSVPANLILVKNISVIGVVWGAQAERDPVLVSRNLAELLRWWEAAGFSRWFPRPSRWPRPARRCRRCCRAATPAGSSSKRNPASTQSVSEPGRPGSVPSSSRRGRANAGSPTTPSPPCRTAPRPAAAARARPERGSGAAPA